MTNASRAVLVIEDDEAIRRFCRSALEVDQYRVIETDTGARGLVSSSRTGPISSSSIWDCQTATVWK